MSMSSEKNPIGLESAPQQSAKIAQDFDAFNDKLLSGHDIIVIGASAGGLDALRTLVRDLPAGLPAAVFVVMHTAPQSPGLLDTILNSKSALPCMYPPNGEPIELGRVYIAPPDYHLLVEQGLIRVVRGPQENLHRPAIDPLFRSAARYYGPRVIGVILSGMLDDGVYGLLVIKQRGGLAVVQDPADALYPDMPENALRKVRNIDYSVPIAELAPLLGKLAHEVIPGDKEALKMAESTEPYSEQLKIEDQFALGDIPDFEIMEKIGHPATIACPDCHGTLWEVKDEKDDMIRFRCRVGHAFTALSLMREHAESLQSALWVALRTLEESVSLNRRLAQRAQKENQLQAASNFMESAAVSEQQADLIKRVLLYDMPEDGIEAGWSAAEIQGELES